MGYFLEPDFQGNALLLSDKPEILSVFHPAHSAEGFLSSFVIIQADINIRKNEECILGDIFPWAPIERLVLS